MSINYKKIEQLLMKKEIVVDLIKEKMPEPKAQALTQVIEILINFTIELQKGKNNAV
ncbi:hypothetical protein [Sulfurimonas sp.]|uniref:hypothetical protein n=1 Tax=Sulfurimonas sp. TaxID=2022749 RepID=UPI0026321649|nr:hypothetical protein [Sulfurimonas sp.]MDD3854649.1 hypothetical protein [Sulfurimonas sp.]